MSLRQWIRDQNSGVQRPAPLTAAKGADIFTIVSLLLGGIIVPALGWLIALGMLIRSRTWTRGEKLQGALLLPFGYLPFALALALPLFTSRCVTSAATATHAAVAACARSAFSYSLGETLLLILTLVLPLVGAWLLYRSARQQPVEIS
jgi:hypothetical protein